MLRPSSSLRGATAARAASPPSPAARAAPRRLTLAFLAYGRLPLRRRQQQQQSGNDGDVDRQKRRRHPTTSTLTTTLVTAFHRRRSPIVASSASDAGAEPSPSPSLPSSPSPPPEGEKKEKVETATAKTQSPLFVRALTLTLVPRSLSPSGTDLLSSTFRSLSNSFWSILLVQSLASVATFFVHRVSHRITNAAALLLLLALKAAPSSSSSASVSSAAIEAISRNPWWLCPDPSVASFSTGYQWVVLVLFLAAFPLTVAVRAAAAAATAFLCLREEEGGKDSPLILPPLLPPIRKTLASVRAVLPAVSSVLSLAWKAELLVALRAVPLQALSLLVLPLPWTFPRLLDLQIVPVVAAVEGGREPGENEEEKSDSWSSAKRSIERAAELTGSGGDDGTNERKPSFFSSLPLLLRSSPRRAALAWPFLFLLVAPRALAAAKEAALASLSPRIATALPEVPLLLAAAGVVGGTVLARMSDVLPFVAWRWFRSLEAAKGRGE